CLMKGDADKLSRTGDRVRKARTFSQEQRNCASKRAASSMCAGRINPLTLPARHIVFFDQGVGEGVAFLVTALDQHRAAVLADQLERCCNRVLLRSKSLELGQVRCGDG